MRPAGILRASMRRAAKEWRAISRNCINLRSSSCAARDQLSLSSRVDFVDVNDMKHDNSTSLTHDVQFLGDVKWGTRGRGIGSTPCLVSPSLSGLFHSSSSTAGVRRAHLSAASRDARTGNTATPVYNTLPIAVFNVHSKLAEH